SGASTLAGTCASSNNAPERVFAWTPAVSGVAQLSTCSTTSTNYDSVVYVRSGSCAAGAEVACNDDAAGCFTSEPNDHHGSRLTVSVTAGQTYFIVVDGYASSAGAFSLTVVPPNPSVPTASPTPPAACQAATDIPSTGGTFTGTTSGTSSLVGTGICADAANAPERVYRWTPTASGVATLRTCDGVATGYDTIVYLRQGDCTGPQVACNDDTTPCFTSEPNDHHGSLITPSVVAGQTYYIVVDGFAAGHGPYA